MAGPISLSIEALRALQDHILASVSDGIHVIALDGTVLVENAAAERMLGRDGERIGRSGHDAIHHHHEDGSEHRAEDCPIYQVARDGQPREVLSDLFWRHDGSSFPVEYRAAPLRDEDGRRYGVVVVFRDISERRDREAELRRLAHYDRLTGLANRTLFSERLQRALARLSRPDGMLALLYLDLDRFKAVNDQHGHATGDQLLAAAAERLQALVRPDDTVARFGGDEFVVLLQPLAAREQALEIAERIRLALREPFAIGGHLLQIGTSIGIAFGPDHGSDEGGLLRAADAAMYRAKRDGTDCWRLASDRPASAPAA